MKKVLILGGAGVHCKLVEAAHEMNLYVIVADYLKRMIHRQNRLQIKIMKLILTTLME